MPWFITVTVYDSAGEKVAQLYQGGLSQMASEPYLSAPAFAAKAQSVNLVFDGTLANGAKFLPWQGLSSSGTPVAGGIYYIHIQTVDPFGQVTSYTLPITVLEPLGDNQVSIFNSAGELVYHLDFASITMTATDLVLDRYAFAPAFDAAGNALSKVTGSLEGGGGVLGSWSWDGRNAFGEVVSPGVYSVVLTSIIPNAVPLTKTWQIQVLDPVDGSDPKPVVLDAPISQTSLASHGGNVVVRYRPAATLSAEATLYNLAGERISHGVDSSGSGTLLLAANACSAGVYFIAFEYLSPSATRKQNVLKTAIFR
jgi:hypothetical protein